MLRSESVQYIDAVVADGVEGDPFRVQAAEGCLQLNELRFAERSPARAAMENDERRAPGAVRMQVNHLSGRVCQHDVWETQPSCGTKVIEIDFVCHSDLRRHSRYPPIGHRGKWRPSGLF